MALKKAFPSEFSDSIFVSYWKIGETNIDWWRKTARVTVYGFADEQARFGNKSAMMIKLVEFNRNNFPFSLEDALNPVARIYETLKNAVHIETRQKIDENGSFVFEQKPILGEDGNPLRDADGNPMYEQIPVMEYVTVKDFPDWDGAEDC